MIVFTVILVPHFGYWSLPFGLLIGWIIKKAIINRFDPLQPTFKNTVETVNSNSSDQKQHYSNPESQKFDISKTESLAFRIGQIAARVIDKTKSAISIEKKSKCTFCSETIKVKAIKCRFCGEWLD